MSMAIIILCVFDTMFPLVMALLLSALLIDERIWGFAVYNGLLSGCLIVIIDLELGISVMPEWQATVAYTASVRARLYYRLDRGPDPVGDTAKTKLSDTGRG